MKITEEFFKKYDKPGPRYTSYPPATFFNTNFKENDLKQCLIHSNSEKPENISLYIHIPFCPVRCFFCGCHTTTGESRNFICKYIDCIVKEISSFAKYLDNKREVTQIHWGGGTPNSIPHEFITKVMESIQNRFTISNNCEIAIECNPAYLDFNDIDSLFNMGFNRISLGIQDFNKKILENINRRPSHLPINKIVKKIRENGFKSINFDLIYGLPRQTLNGFRNTIKKAIEISPDRIATFSYAHVPWVKPHQKKLEKIGLPSPEEKLAMLIVSLKMLTKQGYISIGMDHYAKPDDELALALKERKLHRNFQGYCTRETTGQVYGFGVSSITQLWGAYSQNEKNIKKYIKKIEKHDFAVERGYILTKKDQIRRTVINEIMCNNFLDFSLIADNFNLSLEKIKEIVSYNPDKLKDFEQDDLVVIKNNTVKVNPQGRLVIRNIAMAFDPFLKTDNSQYSKTI